LYIQVTWIQKIRSDDEREEEEEAVGSAGILLYNSIFEQTTRSSRTLNNPKERKQ